MLSIICVYNDHDKLEHRLLASLSQQSAAHQLCLVDNRAGTFRSAAEALNYGAKNAEGDWLLFVHQDVSFLSAQALVTIENSLLACSRLGWAGVVGQDKEGSFRGCLVDRSRFLGEPLTAPAEVQTLDELLLAHRRLTANRFYFDERLTGWHAYGIEACCEALRAGLRNYILPALVWHDSATTNVVGLAEAHAYVWHKHGAVLGPIHSTCGRLPRARPDLAGRIVGRAEGFARRFHKAICAIRGMRTVYVDEYGDALESLTEGLPCVDVIHGNVDLDPIETKGFVGQPARVRQIRHWFGQSPESLGKTACVVIAPERTRELSDEPEKLKAWTSDCSQLWVCACERDLRLKPRMRTFLKQRSDVRVYTRPWYAIGTAVCIFGVSRV